MSSLKLRRRLLHCHQRAQRQEEATGIAATDRHMPWMACASLHGCIHSVSEAAALLPLYAASRFVTKKFIDRKTNTKK
ncbi:hypothetical protein, partial [Oceanisphaera arctica]|uniref:hypothetical protein n=1 Tax=Oceanisphaera arctica TaxID=641510 RepID=UPI001CA4C005